MYWMGSQINVWRHGENLMALTKLPIPQGPGVTVEKLASQVQFHLDRLVNQLNRVETDKVTSTITQVIRTTPGGTSIPNPINSETFLTWAGTGGTTSFTKLGTHGLSQGYTVGTVTTTVLTLGTNTLGSAGDLVIGNGTSTTSLRISYNTLTNNEPTFTMVLTSGVSTLTLGVGQLFDNTPTGTMSFAGTATFGTATITSINVKNGTATLTGLVVNGTTTESSLVVLGTASINTLKLTNAIPEGSVSGLVSDLANKSNVGHTHTYVYYNGTATVTGVTSS
jgi:hypothetical protein